MEQARRTWNARAFCSMHHGEADDNVALDDAKRMAAHLRSRGVPHQLFTYPGAMHGAVAHDSIVLARLHNWYVGHGLITK